MKNIRTHLFAFAASAVLALGVVLAEDQAPAAAPQLPPPQPDAAAPAAAPVPAAAPAPAPAPAADQAPVVAPPPAALPAPKPAALPSRRTTTLLPTTRRSNFAPGSIPAPGMAPSAAAASAASTNDTGDAKEVDTAKSDLGNLIKFDGAALETVLKVYEGAVHKTMIVAPKILKELKEPRITFKLAKGQQLSDKECVEILETILSMYGYVLEPFGDKFIKVLPRKTIRQEGIKFLLDIPDGEGIHPERTQVVSQMIQLKFLSASDLQTVLEGFKSEDGLIQIFKGQSNSILVTDVQENVNRMLEIVKFLDQAVPVRDTVKCYQIVYADVKDIEAVINKLVAAAKQQQQEAKEEIKANTSGSPGVTRVPGTTPSTSSGRPLPPGLTRLGSGSVQPQSPASSPNETLESILGDVAKTGLIRGNVSVLSDERTKKLIVITAKENMEFFDKVIEWLDIETRPDVDVDVVRLKFADASDVAELINSVLSGSSSAKKSTKKTSSSNNPNDKINKDNNQQNKNNQGSDNNNQFPPPKKQGNDNELGKNNNDTLVGKLGDIDAGDVTILADKRMNAIIVKGKTDHRERIKSIIDKLDIQLSQVLIETVVLSVTLKDSFSTGIDWVKRISTRGNTAYSVAGGAGKNTPINLFSTATNIVGGVVSSGNQGIEYYTTLKGLNVDAVVTASQSDNAIKVLSSPVLLTVDNKEATIEVTSMKYMYKGMRYMGSSAYGTSSSYEPDIEQRDVGLTVKVTPRINPSGNVVLTVDEKFEQVGANQTIDGQDWPTISTRKVTADVSVGNGETVILGGLVDDSTSNDRGGIPWLMDIPVVGQYLFGSVSKTGDRSELLIFMTPYVIEKQSDMDRDARRRKDYIRADGIWTRGWSDSKLADPVAAADMKERLSRKEKLEKTWQSYGEKLEEQKEADAKIEVLRNQVDALSGKASTNAPASSGLMKVERSVEVLKPEGAGAVPPADATSGTGVAPVQPPIEQPRKSWWKIF